MNSAVCESQHLQSKGTLKSLLIDASLLQFAVADSHAVMVCVSMSKRLRGLVSEFICQASFSVLLTAHVVSCPCLLACLHVIRSFDALQEALQLFVTKYDSMLLTGNTVTRAKGFTASLYGLYMQVPRHIAQVIAGKLAPTQPLWIVVAQAEALLRYLHSQFTVVHLSH